MFKLRIWTLTLGFSNAVVFTLCVLYGLVAPPELHAAQLLEAILPGFRWISPAMFLLGLIESFAWGVYLALVFVPLHNFFFRRFHAV
jgi:hypothetical protein